MKKPGQKKYKGGCKDKAAVSSPLPDSEVSGVIKHL
jgi:hypothetical protein